jgi:hypothetical protein
VVIPQITIGIYIITFIVLINGYNLLIQFLIVLTILESVTLTVWMYQFPTGSLEFEDDIYFRTITKKMLRCYVVNNITESMEECWTLFMDNYCPEWYVTEAVLCSDSKEKTDIGIDESTIDSTANIMDCYDRFKLRPWSNVTREEVYFSTVSPQTTILLIVHATAVACLYMIARVYVNEYARLRTKWIEELQNYHARLTAERPHQGVSQIPYSLLLLQFYLAFCSYSLSIV